MCCYNNVHLLCPVQFPLWKSSWRTWGSSARTHRLPVRRSSNCSTRYWTQTLWLVIFACFWYYQHINNWIFLDLIVYIKIPGPRQMLKKQSFDIRLRHLRLIDLFVSLVFGVWLFIRSDWPFCLIDCCLIGSHWSMGLISHRERLAIWFVWSFGLISHCVVSVVICSVWPLGLIVLCVWLAIWSNW